MRVRHFFHPILFDMPFMDVCTDKRYLGKSLGLVADRRHPRERRRTTADSTLSLFCVY